MPIEYLSATQTVNMSDAWFEIAALDHFWIRRRFEVLRACLGAGQADLRSVAEIGCGNGVLQRQVGDWLGVRIDGFDLNEFALQQSIAMDHNLYVYNVLEKQVRFKQKYDLVLLFDVLEHVENPMEFLDAAHYMLKPNGRLAINVPALQSLYSRYDRAAGHLLRYDMDSVDSLISKTSFTTFTRTYWGFGLLPILALRKLLLVVQKDEKKIIDMGFNPSHPIFDSLLFFLSKIEHIPHTFVGSSSMVVLIK